MHADKKVRDRVMLEKEKMHALGCEDIEIKQMGAGRNERMKPRGIEKSGSLFVDVLVTLYRA
jgi:hypothetical protein